MQTFDRSAPYHVLFDNNPYIIQSRVRIPDTFGIDDHIWAVIALAQAAAMLNLDFTPKTGLDSQFFEGFMNLYSIAIQLCAIGPST